MQKKKIIGLPPKLNLGCGMDIRKGYVNLDKSGVPGVDVVHNIDKYPWPLPSSHFEEVFAQDVVEHVQDLFKCIKEIQRVCKKGAKVRIIVPYWHSSAAFYPNHHYFFNIDGLKFFTEKDRSYDNYYCFRQIRVRDIPSKLGLLIPPLPVPKRFFPNVLHFRHLMSYVLGEIILKLDFEFEVVK
jgi:hypothetical protein